MNIFIIKPPAWFSTTASVSCLPACLPAYLPACLILCWQGNTRTYLSNKLNSDAANLFLPVAWITFKRLNDVHEFEVREHFGHFPNNRVSNRVREGHSPSLRNSTHRVDAVRPQHNELRIVDFSRQRGWTSHFCVRVSHWCHVHFFPW